MKKRKMTEEQLYTVILANLRRVNERGLSHYEKMVENEAFYDTLMAYASRATILRLANRARNKVWRDKNPGVRFDQYSKRNLERKKRSRLNGAKSKKKSSAKKKKTTRSVRSTSRTQTGKPTRRKRAA